VGMNICMYVGMNICMYVGMNICMYVGMNMDSEKYNYGLFYSPTSIRGGR